MRQSVVLVALVICGLSSCEAQEEAGSTSEHSAAQALTLGASRLGFGYDWYASPGLVPHGVAGDERLVFVTQPLNGRVTVVDRFSGEELAVLPPPPGGWKLPFSLRVPRTGRLVVLDPGGFPSPTTPSFAHLYEYDYDYRPRTRGFSAHVVRDLDFTGQPIVFAEDFEALPGGAYVLSESIVGQLFSVSPAGAISVAVGPASFDPAAAIPALAPCLFTPVMVGSVPFSLPGNVAPGVVGLAHRGGELFFTSTCTGGVSKLPLSTLTDASRAPWERAADITTVSARATGVVEEVLEGITFNRFDPSDPHLYATDSLRHRVVRIHSRTGRRQVVLDDEPLLDFPVALQFLPPVGGVTPLVVASDQEYRLAALNPSIPTDMLHPPFIVTKVYLFAR